MYVYTEVNDSGNSVGYREERGHPLAVGEQRDRSTWLLMLLQPGFQGGIAQTRFMHRAMVAQQQLLVLETLEPRQCQAAMLNIPWSWQASHSFQCSLE